MNQNNSSPTTTVKSQDKLAHDSRFNKFMTLATVVTIGFFLSVPPKIMLPYKCNKAAEKPESCSTAKEERSENAPTIEIKSPQKGNLLMDRDTRAEIRVCDSDGDVNINSLQLNAVYPGTGEDTITAQDQELFQYRQDGDCYDVTINPIEGDLPFNNSIIWRFGVCDCSTNQTTKSIFTATARNIPRYFGMLTSYLFLYLFWFAAIFGPQLLRPKGGKVFDSITGKPLPRTIIRIFTDEGKIIETTATDIRGDFHVKVPKGTYQVMVQKSGYKFPSEIQKTGVGFSRNIYTGGPVKVTSDNNPLRVAIPMDPRNKPSKGILLKKVSSRVTTTLAGMSPVIPVIIILYMSVRWLRPPWTTQIMIFNFVNFLILSYQLYIRVKNRTQLGKVVDTNGDPVANLDISLYSKKYEDLVEQTETSSSGKFLFIVPGDEYILRVSDSRYTFAKSEYKDGLEVGEKKKDNITIHPKFVVEKTQIESSQD